MLDKTNEEIEIKIVPSPGYFRLGCTVCGGCTEKYPVCAKSADDDILVCENCLKAGDIDARLQQHVRDLDAYAAFVDSLIGRLRVPTFKQWEDAIKEVEWPDIEELLYEEATEAWEAEKAGE
jgi:transcription elongation factor Elf1